MSDRTLRRQLQQLDTSFQQIIDDLRRELAINYLCSSDLTVAEISHILNYSDPSNFGNAFKKWTGKSPNSFRSNE